MKIIDVILQNSSAKEAKLYGPAQKASQVPETGIKIMNKAAYNVIKDCATFTVKYLPHYIYGLYANPVTSLKGKLTRADLEEFINAAKQDIVLHQLLVLIKSKIPLVANSSKDMNDPYGEYSVITTELTDLDFLCQCFCE